MVFRAGCCETYRNAKKDEPTREFFFPFLAVKQDPKCRIPQSCAGKTIY